MAKDTGEQVDEFTETWVDEYGKKWMRTDPNGSGGIAFEDFGGGQYDNALRAGMGSVGGGNPYFPGGHTSNGELSLGGPPTENRTPDVPTQPVPDTDFAGGMPDPDQFPGFGPPSGGGPWGGGPGGVGGVDPGYEGIDWGGQESPWQGGGVNQDFYNDQFGQLLGQRNDFQQQQAQAAALRGEQEGVERQPRDYAQMWSDKGLKDVQVSGGQLPEGVDPSAWVRRGGLQDGTTNQQAVNSMSDIWNADETAMWSQYFGKDGGSGDSKYWMSDAIQNDPRAMMSGFKDVSPEFGGALQKFMNNAWGQAGDQYSSGVPEGYAKPT